MRAIILAAGRGSRMGEQTADKPKCLTEFAGKPLIDWQLKALKSAGIKQIAIVRGYKKELLQFPGVANFDNDNWENTNMVASLVCADSWLRDDRCVVCYGDILFPADTISKLMRVDKEIVLPYNTKWLELWKARFDDPLSDAETFQIDQQGFLTEIGNKAKSLEEIQGQYMGMFTIVPSVWLKMVDILKSENYDRMFITDLLQKVLARNIPIATLPIAGSWLEVDNQHDLTVYRDFVKDNDDFRWLAG